ncbi:MAG: carbohydrate ABC transporter permease, partial [Clostridiales bacterium]|nr:carbohydrate ABC transporter permease [Clostridiales bacterium]
MKNKRNQNMVSKLNQINKSTNFLFNIIFIIISLISIIPFVFVFMISITSESSIARNGYQFIPNEFSNNAYLFLWNEKNIIFNALGVSVLVTIVGTILGVLLTTALGYVLSRPQYKLKGFLTWVVFIPMIFNGGMVAS